MEATIAQALMTAALALIFGGFLVWAVRTHQFRDVEEANRRLFEAEQSEPGTDDDAHATSHEEGAR